MVVITQAWIVTLRTVHSVLGYTGSRTGCRCVALQVLHDPPPSLRVHQLTQDGQIGVGRLPEIQVFHLPPSEAVTRLHDA